MNGTCGVAYIRTHIMLNFITGIGIKPKCGVRYSKHTCKPIAADLIGKIMQRLPGRQTCAPRMPQNNNLIKN